MDLETLDDLLVVPAVQLECGPTPELGFLNQRVPGPERKKILNKILIFQC